MSLKNLLLVCCLQLSVGAAADISSRDTLPNSTILEVLSAHSQLSSLVGIINSNPVLVQLLNSADNFTFLGPTNEALSSWLATNPDPGHIEATVQYHLLNGTYASQSIPNTPLFIATALTNPPYCNVTGGQRVKAFNNGYLLFNSGLNTTSTSLGLTTDLLALGGIVHTIDKILDVPIGALQTTRVDNMTYFLALSGEAGFLSAESQSFVDTFFSRPDVTFFIPNSAKAVANTNVSALNESTILQFTNYMAVPRVVYSDGLVDGTQITSILGVPLLVSVINNSIYINDAKVTSVDNFISNGVIHVIDDVLDPRNVTGPLHSSTSVPVPTAQPTNTNGAQNTTKLSKGAKAGIGAGTVVGAALVILGGWALFYIRKRNTASATCPNSQTWRPRHERKKAKELSSNLLHELPQLETRESPIELPSEHDGHRERGQAFRSRM